MITKLAAGMAGKLLTTGLMGLPHATGYMSGDESAGAALLGIPGDMAAVYAGDKLYDKFVKPDQKAKLLNEKTKVLDPKTWKHGLGKGWYKVLGHGVGRLALSIPMFSLFGTATNYLGDKILPHKRKTKQDEQLQQMYANAQIAHYPAHYLAARPYYNYMR